MSDHPVDRLIQELARSGRPASGDELEAIRRRVATAPFFDDASLVAHLEKRKSEGQWSALTTLEGYFRDMGEATRLARRIGVYGRRGGCLAAFLRRRHSLFPSPGSGLDSCPRWSSCSQLTVVSWLAAISSGDYHLDTVTIRT